MYQIAAASFFFFFFATIASLMGFYPLLLHEYGFSPAMIGVVSFGSQIAMTIGASLSLHTVERFRTTKPWALPYFVLLLGGAATIFFALLKGEQRLLLVLLFTALSALCAKGMSSLVDARIVRASFLPGSRLHFEHLRIWGSIGYILALFGLGYLVDHYGTGVIVPLTTLFLFPLGVVGYLVFFSDYRRGRFLEAREESKETEALSSTPDRSSWRVACLFFSVALMWASHAPWSAYFSVYLQHLGWSGSWIAVAFTLGVLAEIGVFIAFPKWQERFSLHQLYLFSTALAVLRWLLLGSSPNSAVILFSQLLHAFSFGAHYLCSVKLTYALLPDHLRDRGQGWLSTFGTSGGMILGKGVMTIAALSLADYSALSTAFLLSSAVALLSGVAFLPLLRNRTSGNFAA
ncbi:MFS transporter [bacterium]|nr:MFS transporter [bacterium]